MPAGKRDTASISAALGRDVSWRLLRPNREQPPVILTPDLSDITELSSTYVFFSTSLRVSLKYRPRKLFCSQNLPFAKPTSHRNEESVCLVVLNSNCFQFTTHYLRCFTTLRSYGRQFIKFEAGLIAVQSFSLLFIALVMRIFCISTYC